jgi:chromosomal replication initiation ATPase DnaA
LNLRQLTFHFPERITYVPEDFLPGPANAEACTWLETPDQWPACRLALYGAGGTGKTHLLHLFAARHDGLVMPARSLRGFRDFPQTPLAIDDADSAPDPESLLHLLNAAAENRLPVLLAARTPPSHWTTGLPDLDSRLRAITTVELAQPDDDLLRALLARLIAQRQLRVEETVQDYLLARLPRTGSAMHEAAARLDRASLAAGKSVSRRIAADVLAGMTDDATFDEDSVPHPDTPSHPATRLL